MLGKGAGQSIDQAAGAVTEKHPITQPSAIKAHHEPGFAQNRIPQRILAALSALCQVSSTYAPYDSEQR
jgi:hypothetical protein